jgi:hypothetical protein
LRRRRHCEHTSATSDNACSGHSKRRARTSYAN